MTEDDSLRYLLIDFFGLAPDIKAEEIRQPAVSNWDSLAMVQLITELQGRFAVEFDLEEIQTLRSYQEIRHALTRKGISVEPSENPVLPDKKA
ncbi:MAG: acyl carrier protein [Verrucomicrobiota bacterium]